MTAARAASIAIGCGLAVAWLMSAGELDPLLIAAIVGVVGAASCAAVAVARFDLFLYGLIAVRPALDGLNQGTQESGAGMLSPSVAVGVVFVGASALWLVARLLSGRLAAPSALAWSWMTLVAAAGLSCLVSDYPVISLAATLRLAAAGLMFVVLEQAVATGVVTVPRLLKAFATAGTLVVAWTLLQAATGTGAADPWTGLTRVTGPFVHPSVLAKFLVLCALLLTAALLWPHRSTLSPAVAGVGLALVLTGLALTYTRAAWAAAMIGVAFMTWHRKRRLVPVLILAVCVMVAAIPALWARVADLWSAPAPAAGAPDNSLAWRISYWEHLVPMMRSSPINGRGIDTIPLIGGQELAAHNIWVQALVEMGAVGLIALVAVVACTWVYCRASLRRTPGAATPLSVAASAAAVALLSMSASENLLNETTTLWYLACALASAGAILPLRNDTQKRELTR